VNLSVAFLSRFCAEHRLEKKFLIVPSHQVGQELRESLAKEGGSWVNLHFSTLPMLAQQLAGAGLAKSGTRFVPSSGSFSLVEKIFRKLKDEEGLDYFGKVDATTGIVRALQDSIFSLRMAGMKGADLKPYDPADESGEYMRRAKDETEDLDETPKWPSGLNPVKREALAVLRDLVDLSENARMAGLIK
jgi:hypothetical protein